MLLADFVFGSCLMTSEVFADDCKKLDSKIDDKKREMLEEWKDIPDANK